MKRRFARAGVLGRISGVVIAFLATEFGVTRPALAQSSALLVTDTHIVTRHDRVPRLCRFPSVVATASGDWSSAPTWPAGVPGDGARVLIPANVTVTYDVFGDAAIDCIEIESGATLEWDTARNTRLRVVNLLVLPGGSLVVGSQADPIAAGVTAEVVFRDAPLDVQGADPAQYGNGLLVFGGLTMHGRPMARTFLRLAREASAQTSELRLERSPDGWEPGDRLIVPDTRQIPFRKRLEFVSQAEEPVIASVSGTSVDLAGPLAHDHLGPRDANGNAGPVELGMLPHAGNLSRNVVVRSTTPAEAGKGRYCEGEENLTGSANCVTRGHAMVFGRASVDVRYTAWRSLGRTTTDAIDNTSFDGQGGAVTIGANQVGRYAFHAHHLAGPVNPGNTGFQYRFVGNVVEGFLKWGVAVHDTHYGLLKDNILYDGRGSAVATEDGNESFNVFERNFVVHTKSGDTEQIIESPGRAGVTLARALFGFTRDGFWFSGMNNVVRDNVVANAPGFAYNYNGYYLTQQQPVPDFRGADMQTDATVETASPVLEFAGNEAYGATGQGLWLTWSRGCCRVDTYRDVSLFEDFRVWHVNNAGVEAYHESRNTFDGFVLRNDRNVTAQSQGGSLRFNQGFHFANKSYENGQTVLRNVDVQGFNVGLSLPIRPEDGTPEPNMTLVEDSFLQNYVNVREHLPTIEDRTAQIRNVRFEPLSIAPIPGLPDAPAAIQMRYAVDIRTNLRNRRSATVVREFDGVPGDDFEVFFEAQAPDFPIPPPPDSDHPHFAACPEPDLSNAECFARHGVAIAGAVAPCVEHDGDSTCAAALARAAARGIDGLVFPLVGGQPPPAPENLRIR